MADFPTSVVSFTDKVDGNTCFAAHINKLQDEVEAIETYIGTGGSAGPWAPVSGTVPGPPTWSITPITVLLQNNVYKIAIDWEPVVSTDCAGYIVQRAETEMSVTSPSTWITIASPAGIGSHYWLDANGLRKDKRYWYKIACINMAGEIGTFTNAQYGDTDSATIISAPDAPSNLEIYIDLNEGLTASWTLPAFDYDNNYIVSTEIVVTEDASDPTNTSANFYHTGKASYPMNLFNIFSLWLASDERPSSTDDLYVYIRTNSMWGLNSSWIKSSSFNMQTLLSAWTAAQGTGLGNFETLVENFFYDSVGDSYSYDQGTFPVDAPDLQIIGQNIAAGTIQCQALAVGSGHRNFDLIGVEFIPNYDGSTTNNGWLTVTTSHAYPLLQIISNPNEEKTGDITTWYVNNFESTTLIPHPNQTGVSKDHSGIDEVYYIYVKCNKTDETDCDILLVPISSSGYFMPPDGADHDSTHYSELTLGITNPNDYYWFKAGVWDVSSTRAGRLGLSYGFTFLDGNHIYTGQIDCNKVTVSGAGGDVIIDGNNITVTNGKMDFTSAGSNVTIDSTGISGSDGSTSFSLTDSGGLDITAGTGSSTHIDSNGIWTGTSATTGSVNIDDSKITIYNNSGTQEVLMGNYTGSSYGFLAGASASSGQRAILDKDGLRVYDSSGDLMLDSNDGSSGYVRENYNSQEFTSNGTFTVPDGVYSLYVTATGGGGGGAGGNGVFGGGGGGGGGRFILRERMEVTPGTNVSVVIGPGGLGGSPGNDGTTGQTTIVGSYAAGGGRGGSTFGPGGRGASNGGEGGTFAPYDPKPPTNGDGQYRSMGGPAYTDLISPTSAAGGGGGGGFKSQGGSGGYWVGTAPQLSGSGVGYGAGGGGGINYEGTLTDGGDGYQGYALIEWYT